jgi:hypothetical protein
MAGVVHIQWYAAVFRGDSLADGIVDFAAPAAMRYGATRYTVQRSQDDRYRILQAVWFLSKDDWYRYWEGREMSEFRARFSGKYQIPIVYVWHDELASDSLPSTASLVRLPGPEDSDPDPAPQAA